MEDLDFNLVRQELTKAIGFNCRQLSEPFLKRRLDVRMHARGITGYKDYLSLLSDDTEKSELIRELSIHVTHFFRDKTLWNTFSEEVIPLMINGGRKSIKVWSAGCSTGEEPVSIAISFLEKIGVDVSFTVIATDIDTSTIAKAKSGLYLEMQFRETDPALLEKYFDKEQEGYRVKDSVLKHINYQVADILHSMPEEVDLIFCRNTVIYFSKDMKEMLYERMFANLRHEGFLVLGMTEILLGKAKDLFQIYSAHDHIYFKE